MPWAWIVIGLGALIIVTRLPLVFRPLEALGFYRGLFANDTRVRLLGVFYVAFTWLFFLAAAEATEGLQAFLAALALLTLVFAGWTLAHPRSFREFANGMYDFFESSVDANILRGLGIAAVLFGAWLVWMGVQAL